MAEYLLDLIPHKMRMKINMVWTPIAITLHFTMQSFDPDKNKWFRIPWAGGIKEPYKPTMSDEIHKLVDPPDPPGSQSDDIHKAFHPDPPRTGIITPDSEDNKKP